MNIATLQDNIINDTLPLSYGLLYVRQLLEQVGDNKEILWLDREINGYDEIDDLPQYRCVHAPVKFLCESPFRKSQICSLEKLEDDDNPSIASSFKRINTILIRDSIAAIESTWKNIKGFYGECRISDKQIELLEQWYESQLKPVAGYITSGWHEIPQVSVVNIFNTIKVRLLSILNYLSSKYPDLNKIQMNSDTHLIISGNNNPINIINGQNNFLNSTNTISEELSNKLKNAGVTESEMTELENIIKSEPPKSVSLKDKINKWIKGLSISADIVTISQYLATIL